MLKNVQKKKNPKNPSLIKFSRNQKMKTINTVAVDDQTKAYPKIQLLSGCSNVG
jgi:hypothetical protein